MQKYEAIIDRLKGPLFPVIPAFLDDETLDIESTCKHVDWAVTEGMPMVWLTGGSSRYSSMTEQEIWDLTKALADTIGGRAVFFGGTNYNWPVHLCRKYIADCAGWGVDLVTIHPWGTGNENLVVDFHKAVAQDSPLPLFAYSAAMFGSAGITVPMLKRILEIPQFVGMKNDIGDFYEHRSYLWAAKEAGRQFVPMTGGSMMSFLWGYDFGAEAFTAAYSLVAPRIPLEFYKYLIDGRRDEAVRIVHDYEETMLADLAAIGGWQALKAFMVFRGFHRSWKDRYPFPTLTDENAQIVKAHLEKYGLL